MSIQSVVGEIRTFISGTKASVLCIRGPWGVGKTFTWESELSGAAKEKSSGLKHYAYVSLFGVNSLDALKLAIFENTSALRGASLKPEEQTLGDLYAELEKHARPWTRFAESIPVIKNFVPSGLTSTLSFMLVRKMIVCFDDLERRGKGLDLSDVLGLASMLKERRGCRVVLLLNEERLGEERKTFNQYLEKVTDTALMFDPSSEEAVTIAQGGDDPLFPRAAELCRKLGLRNIRVMKKIGALVQQLDDLLHGFDARVLSSATMSTALFAWSHYDPDTAPSFDFLKEYNRYASMWRDEKPSDQHAAWNALLESYGYTSTDEFDIELMQSVARGYFVPEDLRIHAQAMQKTLEASDAAGSFSDAWAIFHESFDTNEDELIERLDTTFRQSFQTISPGDMNSTYRLLKDLGRADLAKELLELYVTRKEDRKFFKVEEYPFRESLSDPDVIQAFNIAAENAEEPRDFAELLQNIRDGWSGDDIGALAALSVDDYRALFKEEAGAKLRRMIANALWLGQISNADADMLQVASRAKEALKLIGAESNINALRVAKYGVSLKE